MRPVSNFLIMQLSNSRVYTGQSGRTVYGIGRRGMRGGICVWKLNNYEYCQKIMYFLEYPKSLCYIPIFDS